MQAAWKRLLTAPGDHFDDGESESRELTCGSFSLVVSFLFLPLGKGASPSDSWSIVYTVTALCLSLAQALILSFPVQPSELLTVTLLAPLL